VRREEIQQIPGYPPIGLGSQLHRAPQPHQFVRGEALELAHGEEGPLSRWLTGQLTETTSAGQPSKGKKMATKKRGSRTSIVRSDEEELIQEVRNGNRGAFKKLVDAYQNSLLMCALDIVKNRADAEDVVQESFVKAYLSLDKFRGQSSFYTWVYRITLNMAIDLRRKVARRGGETFEFDESWGQQVVAMPQEQQNPAQQVLTKERLGELQVALNTLSDDHRLVILMREVEGMSYDEIARSLGISVGTVMSRLHYGRKNLQQLLSQNGEPTEIREISAGRY
jgi:RNA polymerase sigma-70 factor, ECF subfamily